MKWCKGSVLMQLFSFMVLSYAKENVCPGSKASCPEDSTCCQLSSGSYGCCPIKNAICCQDSVHCCPVGYTCDVIKGVCQMGDKSKPLLKKIPAIPAVNEIAEGNVVICASGEGQCPPDHSCCSVPGTGQVHCCPGGYWCEKGVCRESSVQFPAAVLTSSSSKIVKCNQEFACPDRHTCCKVDKSYLCCPLPQAVCCSDHMHCCQRGFKCSPDGKTCSSGTYAVPALSASSPISLKKGFNKLLRLMMQGAKRGMSPSVEDTELSVVSRGSKILPFLEKLPASKRNVDASSVVCPDGASECPDGNTCCKLSSGEWGCCPLPNAVCCSDGEHCCPNGYTCDVSAGTCSQGNRHVPMVTKLPASKRKPDVNSIVCPDGQSECPDGDTCCKLASGEWGCCPLPEAVCCSDGVHCCPNGYTCSAGVCSRGSKILPLLEKLPASKRNVDESSVVCPDEESECPDGNTCCKLSSGQWGCCPLPQAVCCSDGVHCCPNGYTCDVSAGTCSQESKTRLVLTKLPASKIKVDVDSVVCPDGASECPDGNTCCKLSSGEWGCCPLPEAVCCSDGLHCCPNGYTCDVSAGTCSQGNRHVPMVTKLPASKRKPDVNSIVCPDGQSECPNGDTCCKLASGEWGCCPLPGAVCCSDGVHCCPNGYTCSAGVCSRGSKILPLLEKLPASKRNVDASSVVCPDEESECPDGNTCCKLSSGQWGCCPLPQAVCCSDGVHCCPNGYTCDVSAGTCSQESKTRPILTKLPASKIKVDVDSVVCPDGASECPDGNTCCKLSSGEWGCCPLPNAVCCSDGEHCCPNGYTCDVSAGTCSQGNRHVPMVTKLPASKRKPDVNSIVCPDGQSECPDGDTCCKLASGEWGCCPLPEAVCCSDGVHCCPNGYTCSAGVCSRGSKILPLLDKLPASKRNVDESSVVCPDEESECPDGNTCCKLSSGQWGCCPLPQAVCCSDGVHCCPNGYTCDVSAGTCSQESKTRLVLTKLPASKIKVDVDSVVCPDGASECPDGNTCCKLSSGEWGCCPLPEAVCCSDGLHCCPNGYTCDVSAGTCSQGNRHVPMVTKLPASKRKPDVNSIVCPDGQSECPDGDTCCKLASGEWGCCPLPEAVCCSDGVHCCPNGYTCSAGVCSRGSKILPLLDKLPASKRNVDASSVVCPDEESECPDGNTCCKLSSGQWGCCPLPQAVCCSDGVHCCPNGYTCDVSAGTCSQEIKTRLVLTKLPASKIKVDVDSVVCPDGASECPDGNTCCKLSSGEWGCCPLPEAVCCSDGLHCCPNGYTCDVSAGTCSQGNRHVPMVTKLPASKRKPDVNSIVCPDGQSECPDGDTCCKLASGEWGCCPLPEAVCCSDGVHCCPNGYTCSAGVCSRGSKILPLLDKLPASKRNVDASSVVCPDEESECPDGNTCCKLSSGQWGCCPLPQAVCCSDGVHCCPNGYTCDVSAGTCSQESKTRLVLTKLPASKIKVDVDSVVCPDGASECPDGNTCCKLSSGEWGCCPLPEAVCCSDGLHCCPNGYTCDVSAGTCSQGNRHIPLVTKLPASKRKSSANVICPDKQFDCPGGTTCCKLSSGQWGCCPLPHAVCCDDGKHCCPEGYTCDVAARTCDKGSESINMFQKVLAVEKTSEEREFDGVVCPDKKYQCPNGTTCCKLSSGTFGCCPLKDAVCCSDNKHCCPEGYICDVKQGKCNKTAEHINVINNIPVTRASTDADVKYITCPDGSTCIDEETCCELSDGTYGCCPMPDAVCCSDHEHCCPCGYRCDVAAEMCVTGNVRLPMMQKTKSSRRPKTDHVNLNEKIRFVPKHARDEDMLDPDAIPWLPRP